MLPLGKLNVASLGSPLELSTVQNSNNQDYLLYISKRVLGTHSIVLLDY